MWFSCTDVRQIISEVGAVILSTSRMYSKSVYRPVTFAHANNENSSKSSKCSNDRTVGNSQTLHNFRKKGPKHMRGFEKPRFSDSPVEIVVPRKMSPNETSSPVRPGAERISRIKQPADKPTRHSRKIFISPSNDVVYGIFPILFALKQNRRTIYKLYHKGELDFDNTHIDKIFDLCTEKVIQTEQIPKNVLLSLVPPFAVTQGLCLEASPLSYEQAPNLESSINSSELWLYLDKVHDPVNFGAVLRTAYYFGVNRILTGANNCPLTCVVSKASAGIMEIVPISYVKKPVDYISSLKEVKFQIICTVTPEEQDAVDIDVYQRTGPSILIMGNEGYGVSKELKKMADVFLTIRPDRNCVPGTQSLNVSTATAILLHTLLRSKR